MKIKAGHGAAGQTASICVSSERARKGKAPSGSRINTRKMSLLSTWRSVGGTVGAAAGRLMMARVHL